MGRQFLKSIRSGGCQLFAASAGPSKAYQRYIGRYGSDQLAADRGDLSRVGGHRPSRRRILLSSADVHFAWPLKQACLL
jgi:hypothetical protein